MSNKVINPLKGITEYSWFFEQQVYNPDGIARAIKSTDGSGNVPKVIIYEVKLEEKFMCMKESKIIGNVIQVANIVDDTNIGFKNPQRGRVYSAKGISPAVCCFQGGNLEPKIVETNMEDKNAIELPSELNGKKFRIRKLTPRECFRLMGVDDKDIDKIQSTGVSNSAQYKLAGNSIVVDVLFHIFKKMFIETESEESQLTLF